MKSTRRIELDVARMLFRQLPWALTANAAVTLLVAVALWSPERAALLAGWGAAQAAAILLRAGLLARVRRRGLSEATMGGYTALFVAGVALSGALWGLAAALFLEPGEPRSTVMVSFALGGMAAGAVTTLSVHAPSFAVFLLASLCPLVLTLASGGDGLHLVMAAMVAVFAAVLFLIGRGFRLAWCEVLRLSEEKQHLLDTMERQVVERTAALKDANVKLHGAMAERLRAQREAERARAEAERANRAKTTFLAVASHDLRQPVQSLSLLVATLGVHLQGHPARPVLAHVEKTTDGLRTLLDGILDVSRLDAGGVIANVSAIPLGPTLQRLADEYRLRGAERGLSFRHVPTSAWCLSDPVLLDRILRNLVENALRYTESGGILLGCRRSGDRIVIQVVDTGIGIADEQLDEIFTEFFQVSAPAGRDAHGVGLGLAIVSRLTRVLDHEVTVRSRLGRGSCFSLALPLADPSAARGGGEAA